LKLLQDVAFQLMMSYVQDKSFFSRAACLAHPNLQPGKCKTCSRFRMKLFAVNLISQEERGRKEGGEEEK